MSKGAKTYYQVSCPKCQSATRTNPGQKKHKCERCGLFWESGGESGSKSPKKS